MDINRLSNQIYGWLEKQPYWLKYAGAKILDNGELDDELFKKVYCLFKEDVKLQEPSMDERSELDFSSIDLASDTNDTTVRLKWNSD